MNKSLLFIFSMIFLFACKKEDKLFTSLESGETGVSFNNFIEEDEENNVLNYGYFYNGGGVAAADFNNDGLIDLYFTGNMVANKLYVNKGEMKFEDVSEQSGTDLNLGWKTGVSVVDINNDGWVDLYVCRAGAQDPNLRSNLLYVNQGKTADGIPKFIEKAREYGLDDMSYTTQAVFFDYDLDGDTDCFLLNHSVQKYAGFSNLLGSYRQQRNDAYGSKLLRNDGGKYNNVSDSAGIVSNVLSFGLGINVTDFNQDGWPDIYISNDYNENDYLYINQKNGSFREVIRDATGHVSLYSMGTDAADINNDGLMDILTLDMLPAANERIKLTAGDDNYDKYQQLLRGGFHHQTMRNMLQINAGVDEKGNPVFSEIGQLAGVSNTDWSWAALMADFDNDGWNDIFITNGYARDYTNMEFLKYSTDIQVHAGQGGKAPTQMEIIKEMPPINEPNYIFQNQRNLKFTKKITEWGFDAKTQSNGAVYADLDNDGDLDLVTNNVNQKASVYRNNGETLLKSNYLKVQLKSAQYATLAGAIVSVFSGDSLRQVRNFMPVRGFQSSQWDAVHFGLGNVGKVDSVSVRWANGRTQTVRDVVANQLLTVNYDQKLPVRTFQTAPAPEWKAADLVNFKHQDDTRNDFRIQTLLPGMLTYQGPRMARADLNKDGVDDFYIGGGRNQGGQLFISQGSRGWVVSPQTAFQKDAGYEDAGMVFFDADGDGDQDLIVTSEGYELTPNDPLSVSRLYINEGKTWKRRALPAAGINASAVAVADFDHDEDLDIFLGTRVTPARFPESTGGVLLRNDGKGDFTDATSQVAPDLSKAGMVTDAVWQDLNRDGFPELVITSDWTNIKVFGNSQGKLTDVSAAWGTASLTGCWNTLKSADLDGDGDTDFVVGNMGQNWQWNITSPDSLALYAADFDGLDRLVPVIAVTENGKEYPYASRDELLDQIPSLKKKYSNYVSYSKASLSDMLPAEKLSKARRIRARELRSGILENKNGKLVFIPLPTEAQFSPVYALALADVNGDSKPDILAGGNLMQTRVRMGKNDAGLVQTFINKGSLRFDYLPQSRSGLFVQGDVRSLEVIGAGQEKTLVIGINNGTVSTFRIHPPTVAAQ